YDVTVDFDDSIAEDRDANANFYLKLVNSGLMPRYMGLMHILKVPEEKARELIKEAKEEAATELPDVSEIGGGGV
ncbi:portal protein, partial [Bacillus cereus]